jgi:hypothetical protein
MIAAIPNISKTVQVNYPFEVCKFLMDNFNEALEEYRVTGYHLEFKDEVLNTYTYKKGEILSFGVKIIIGIQPSANQTVFTVEVQREIGAFDRAHEIGMANGYLNDILRVISMGLNPPSEEEAKLFIKKHENAQIAKEDVSTTFSVLFVVFFVLPFLVALCSR